MADQLTLGHAELAALSAEVLERGSSLRFIARGGSMFPFIRDGDCITLEPVAAAVLKVGDVILCRTTGNGLVAHRLIGWERRGEGTLLVVRGDASRGPGERARADQVLGRVVSVQHGRQILCTDQGWLRLAALAWIKFPFLRRLLSRLIRLWEGQPLSRLSHACRV